MGRGNNIPVVQLRRLRGELRRARELAGLTQKQVAEDLNWSLSKVIRQETGAQNISTSDVMALIHYYKITDPDRVEFLLAITRAKEQVWWWDEYRDIFPKRFVELLGYEASAASIRQFQTISIPGLLQTEAYARALFSSDEEPDMVELALRVRLRRQEILHRDHGVRLEFILDEAVIHRVVGSSDIMVEQLLHLRKLSGRPHISIRVVPFTAGVTAALNGSFAVIEFTPLNSNNSDLGNLEMDYVVDIEGLNVEGPKSDVLIYDNPETASNYVEAFERISLLAMSEEKSDRLLEACVNRMHDDLGSCEDP